MYNIFIKILLFIMLLLVVICIHNYNYEFFRIFDFIPYSQNLQNLQIPSGYDSGTRSYMNPYFAIQIAQGLDTN